MQREHALDHVGVVVDDLDDAESVWRKLGFRLTPRSQHFGSRTPGAAIEPFGTSNHCAMLRTGYVEIVGISDPTLFSQVPPGLGKYQGIHVVALDCTDADATHRRLREAGIAAAAPVALQRNVPYGEGGSTTRQVAFRNINVERNAFLEANFILIEHLTPDVMWQPHLLLHANRAVSLAQLWIVNDDRAASSARLAALIDCPAQNRGGVISLHLPHGRLDVCDEKTIARLFPGEPLPRLPWVAAIGFGVSDLSQTKAHLDTEGIPFRRVGDAIWIDQSLTRGAIVVFMQDGRFMDAP